MCARDVSLYLRLRWPLRHLTTRNIHGPADDERSRAVHGPRHVTNDGGLVGLGVNHLNVIGRCGGRTGRSGLSTEGVDLAAQRDDGGIPDWTRQSPGGEEVPAIDRR